MNKEDLKSVLGLEALKNYEQISSYRYASLAYGLERVRTLLAAMNHPEKSLKCIHIAGTKGKGSTSYLTASILARHGYRVGLYTSPHLLSLNERIRLFHGDQEALIRSDVLSRLIQAALVHAEGMRIKGGICAPTYFEVLTVVALAAFAEAQMEFAVLETGLGGRFDATNIVDPLVSVITPVSLDHTHLLGTTLKAIAREKAGVIKPGRPCISMNREPVVLKVIRETAKRARTFLIDAAARSRFTHVELLPRESRFSLATDRRDYGSMKLSLPGEFQLENVAAAIHALEVVEGYGMPPMRVSAIKAACAKARWPGRLQVLNERPWVIVDGAHNEASALALRASISRIYPHRRLLLVFAAARDKDLPSMGKVLCPMASEVLLTSFDSPRASSPEEIMFAWKPHLRKSHVFMYPRVSAALEDALSRAGKEDLVCVTGSLYAVAEALQARRKIAVGQSS